MREFQTTLRLDASEDVLEVVCKKIEEYLEKMRASVKKLTLSGDKIIAVYHASKDFGMDILGYIKDRIDYSLAASISLIAPLRLPIAA